MKAKRLLPLVVFFISVGFSANGQQGSTWRTHPVWEDISARLYFYWPDFPALPTITLFFGGTAVLLFSIFSVKIVQRIGRWPGYALSAPGGMTGRRIATPDLSVMGSMTRQEFPLLVSVSQEKKGKDVVREEKSEER